VLTASALAHDKVQAGQLEAQGVALGRGDGPGVCRRQLQRGLQMRDGLEVGAHRHGAVGSGFQMRQSSYRPVAADPVVGELIADLLGSTRGSSRRSHRSLR